MIRGCVCLIVLIRSVYSLFSLPSLQETVYRHWWHAWCPSYYPSWKIYRLVELRHQWSSYTLHPPSADFNWDTKRVEQRLECMEEVHVKITIKKCSHLYYSWFVLTETYQFCFCSSREILTQNCQVVFMNRHDILQFCTDECMLCRYNIIRIKAWMFRTKRWMAATVQKTYKRHLFFVLGGCLNVPSIWNNAVLM
jgi:hypothetical protein